MYATNTDIDYKNTTFKYPDLTRIIGEPITASLLTLIKKSPIQRKLSPFRLRGGRRWTSRAGLQI